MKSEESAAKEIKDTIDKLNNKQLDDIDIKFFLMWRMNSKGEMLFSYGIFDNNEKEDWIKRIKNDYSEIPVLEPYNVIFEKSEVMNFAKRNQVDKAIKYINSVSDKCDESISPRFTEDLESVRKHLNKVKGYCVKITFLHDNSQYYLFGGVNNFNYLKKKGFMQFGNVTNTSVDRLTDSNQLIGILPSTVCLITDNFIYINKRKKFEDLFGLLESYKREAKIVVDTMEKYPDFYIGVQQLKKDIDKKPIYARSLVNFQKHPDRLDTISKHIEDIREIKNDPKFKDKYSELEVTDEGIIYTTETMTEFLSILNEKPVQSLVTKSEFFAERDEEV